MGVIARYREASDPPRPSQGDTPARPAAVDTSEVLNDRLSRIRYIVAGAYGRPFAQLCAKPADPHGQLARSVAIAIARDILSADLGALAAHFGCDDTEETAGHCNLVAARAARDCRLRITIQFLRGACVSALGLDEPPTSPIPESPL